MTLALKYLFFLTTSVLCSNVKADQWPSPKFLEIIDPVTATCMNEAGLDESYIDNVKKGNIPEDDKLKAYLLCIMKKLDVIDYTHHDFEYWKILSMVTQEMKKPVFEMGKGCLHIKGEDYGKASLEFIKCLHKANPEKFAFLF